MILYIVHMRAPGNYVIALPFLVLYSAEAAYPAARFRLVKNGSGEEIPPVGKVLRRCWNPWESQLV